MSRSSPAVVTSAGVAGRTVTIISCVSSATWEDCAWPGLARPGWSMRVASRCR